MKRYILFYVLLVMTVASFFPSYAQSSSRPTLHTIIFALTNDSKIGHACAADFEKAEMLMDNISYALSEDYDNTGDDLHFYGEDCNADKVREVIKNLDCGPNDIVIFFYSGHGARWSTDTSKFSRLAFSSGNSSDWIPVTQIDKELAAKAPKGIYIFTQCCNVTGYFTSKTNENNPLQLLSSGGSIIGNTEIANIKKMFTSEHQRVVSTSSRPDEYSWVPSKPLDDSRATKAGYYVDALYTSLNRAFSGVESNDWNSILNQTEIRTVNSLRGIHDEHGNPCMQHPIYIVSYDFPRDTVARREPRSKQPRIEDNVVAVINSIIGKKTNIASWVNPVKDRYFAPNAVVDVVGVNGITIVSPQEPIDRFLPRIVMGMAGRLAKVSVLQIEKDSETGRITYMKVHEIYNR